MAETVTYLAGALIGLPILAYLVMKFGTAGYLRAMRRNQTETKNQKAHEQTRK